MGLFGESDAEKDARDNETNSRLLGEQGMALGRKLLKEEEPISQDEVEAFRKTYDNIITFCDRYRSRDGIAEYKENITAAFSMVYPKASYRARLTSSPEAQALDALIKSYTNHFQVISQGVSSEAVSAEDFRKLRKLGDQLRQAEPTASKYFDAKMLANLRGLLEQHEELVRSLESVVPQTGVIEAMKHCDACGKQNPDDYKFCMTCGKPFSVAAKATAAAAGTATNNSIPVFVAAAPPAAPLQRPAPPTPVGTATASQQIEPFGFKAGMTKAQITALLGESVKQDNGDLLVLTSAPKPHPDFECYLVCVSASKGLAKVSAVSKDIESNSFGGPLKEKFAETRKALESKYGKATTVVDGLLDGSIWDEPEDWMMGLANEERTLNALWEQLAGVGIALLAGASSSSQGNLTVQYEFTSLFASWKQEHDQKKNESF
jgi:hypothetical protein